MTDAAIKSRKSILSGTAIVVSSLFLLAACGSSTATTTSGSGGASASSSSSGIGGGTGTTTGSGGCMSTVTTPLSCDVNAGGVDPASGALTDWTAAGSDAGGTPTWNNTTGKWGTAGNLTGSVFAYRGPNTTTTDWPAQTVADGAMSDGGNIAKNDYAGMGMAFDQCVNTSKFTGITFKLTGNKAGCTLQFQLQTLDQQATANKGLCDTCLNSCYAFPKATINDALDPATPTTISLMFSDLTGGMPAMASDFAKEIIGFQWHFQAGSSACTGVALSVDDVAFTM